MPQFYTRHRRKRYQRGGAGYGAGLLDLDFWTGTDGRYLMGARKLVRSTKIDADQADPGFGKAGLLWPAMWITPCAARMGQAAYLAPKGSTRSNDRHSGQKSGSFADIIERDIGFRFKNRSGSGAAGGGLGAGMLAS